MKKILLAAAALLIAATAFAQGVQFERGDWKSVLGKANKAHKLIYVDAYTTWCGPCKMLEKQVFPEKAAGDKYNKLFINYRFDAEKGEGIELAKKYAVNSYPTNLFINPANGEVVYRTSGTSGQVADFVKEADIALREFKDPMTWDKYTAQFKSGKRDKAFLKAYLRKAATLNKNNDALLNAYVKAISAEPVTSAEVTFIAGQMMTSDNDGLAYISRNRKLLIESHPDDPEYLRHLMSRLTYGTFEKGVETQNIVLVEQIARHNELVLGTDDEAKRYWYRTQYYTKIGDEPNALKAGMEEADFLTARPDDYYVQGDERSLQESRLILRRQLQTMKVPAEQLEEQVAANVEKNAVYRHGVSLEVANTLNQISWNIYEHHAKEEPLTSRALAWSKRSLELSEGLSDWPSFADTYAHLLYVSGKKQDAIKTQLEAINRAKAVEGSDVAGLEQSLKQMQDGTL